MNRIGIVGGIGPETTVEYYRRIIALYRRRDPDGSAPYIIINSLDMKKPLEMLTDSKMDELVPGIILAETRNGLMNIIKDLKDRAQIDGAILGGTELSLILRDETVFGVRILDTTQIHVEAAVAQLLGMSANANPNWPTR